MSNFTPEQLREIAEVHKEMMVLTGQKHDPSTTVSNWVGAHGAGGLFSDGAVRPDMYSAIARPRGLSQMIPLVGSRMNNEVYEILTGQTVTEGTRAADICSEGPMAGKLKVCRQVIPFGEMKIDTSVERLTRFGRRIDYSDLDRNVLNLDGVGNPLLPQILDSNNVNSDTGKMLYEAYLAIERSYALMDINGVNGNTSNAADYNLWISQFNGLAREIRTGRVDSVSSVACPAADSIVITHNAPIASNGTNGQTFVANVVNLVRSAMQRANDVGMGDFDFALAMHPSAAWAVYDVWACNYYTDRCTGAAGNEVTRDAVSITNFRDGMRRGQYLLVDGMQIPVVFTHGLQWEGVSNGVFNTDILLIPLRWSGRPLLYRHFFPLNNADATAWLNAQPNPPVRIINNGLYAVGMRTTNGFCSKIEIISQTRLILDTPFLAGRLNDVQVGYQVSGFDPYPGMSNYVNGGQSSRF